MKKKKEVRFEGEIKPLKNCKSFYMVLVDGMHNPSKRHETYEEAFNEMLRLSKKENRKAYVLLALTEVELIPNVTKLNTL